MNDVDFLSIQYQTLREEINKAYENGAQIMALGLAAIGLLANAAFQARATRFGFVLFAVVLPLASHLVLSMWFATHERIARASHYNAGLERVLERQLNVQVPTWELWLRLPDDQGRVRPVRFLEYAGMSLFILIALGSIVFAFSISDAADVALPVAVPVVLASAAAAILQYANIDKRRKLWARHLSSTPSLAGPAGAGHDGGLLQAGPGAP